MQGVVLAGEAGVAVAVLGRGEQLDGLGGGRAGATGAGQGDLLGTAYGGVPRLPAVDLGPLDGDLAGEDVARPEQGLLEEVGAGEDRVGETELEGLLAADGPAVVEGVLDDQRHRGVGTDEVRHEERAAPAGDQAEHDLGQAQGRCGVHDGAVGAVQRDLEAAAQREAVDEPEGGLLAVAELAEDRVTELGHHAHGVRAAAGDRGEVGARGQDERLAGHSQRGHLVVGQRRVDGGVEADQAAGTEGVGLGVVLAVVEGDQADHAGAARQGHLAQLGLGDALGVGGGDLLGAGQEGRDVAHVRPSLRSSGGSPR